MATKMKMVKKGNTMVPDFAVDGKGKMQMGGTKRLTTIKRPIDLNLKERKQKNAPLKGGKMQKGGKTTSFTDDIATGLDNVFRKTYPFNIPHTKVTKALKAVDDRITKGHEGEQPDWYNKFKDKVKKTMKVPNKKQAGGPTDPVTAMYKAKGEKVPTTKKTIKYVRKRGSGLILKDNSKLKEGTYKTGGMVNPNAKLQAAKAAGSHGVMSGVNPKAAASKVARGRVGGTSVAPKKAIPKASYGMSMSKMQMGGGTGDGTRTFNEVTITAPKPKGKPKAMYGMATKPGMMKKGGAKKK